MIYTQNNCVYIYIYQYQKKMTNWKPGKNVEHIIFTIPETPLFFLVAVICPGTHPTASLQHFGPSQGTAMRCNVM